MEKWKKWTNQWASMGPCNTKNACTQQNQFLLQFACYLIYGQYVANTANTAGFMSDAAQSKCSRCKSSEFLQHVQVISTIALVRTSYFTQYMFLYIHVLHSRLSLCSWGTHMHTAPAAVSVFVMSALKQDKQRHNSGKACIAAVYSRSYPYLIWNSARACMNFITINQTLLLFKPVLLFVSLCKHCNSSSHQIRRIFILISASVQSYYSFYSNKRSFCRSLTTIVT
jgi:hypothetical protein